MEYWTLPVRSSNIRVFLGNILDAFPKNKLDNIKQTFKESPRKLQNILRLPNNDSEDEQWTKNDNRVVLGLFETLQLEDCRAIAI